MNRCLFLPRFSWPRHTALVCTWVALALGQSPMASAQTRTFPAAAQQAAMVVTQSPAVLLNGQPNRLSPGARIHDTNNLLVQPASLTGNQYLVNYVVEFTGLIREVWILTPAEAALPLPTQP